MNKTKVIEERESAIEIPSADKILTVLTPQLATHTDRYSSSYKRF
jgi:hypothetical protein